MTPVNKENAALLSQCLDLCQTLSSKSLTFSFALSFGNSFSFRLDTSGRGALSSEAKKKKKKSPSALRRNARRRAEFLKNKLGDSTSDTLQSEHVSVEEAVEKVVEKAFKCDQCENSFKSENGLKIHAGKSHKKVTSLTSTPDRLRQQLEGSVSLSASPLLDTRREESSPISAISETPTNIFCKSCRNYMTPNHTCHQCGGCGKICDSRDDLCQHNNTIHPLMCYRCFQFFKDKESKAKHWREIHLMNLKPTDANQGSLK